MYLSEVLRVIIWLYKNTYTVKPTFKVAVELNNKWMKLLEVI